VLTIVMEDVLEDGELAVMYQEGDDAIILISRHGCDDDRCAAVNRLIALYLSPPAVAQPVRLVAAG
jgi:hypothetical protein